MFGTLFEKLDNHRNKRSYSKNRINNLDKELTITIKEIEEDPEAFILDILDRNEEKIIVYRSIFDQSEKYNKFYISLKVITRKGTILNRIRLSANYIDADCIEICDIEVFGENEGRGYGSILLSSLINFAIDNSVKKISGWISYTDKDHFDKLEYFYNKHGFKVFWNSSNAIANKAADIIWSHV